MTVKIASLVEIDKITQFAQYYKEKKGLFTDSEFDPKDFKQFLIQCMRTKWMKVFISEREGEVKGFLIMSVDKVPWDSKSKWASDVLFAAEKDAHKLVRFAVEWAKAHKCWKIFFSNSTGLPQADKFFELIGMKRTGGQYEYVL